jgi:hypothetical protein
MLLDPIVAEIRAVRERIAAECDFDFHKICLHAEKTLQNWPGKIVTKEELDRDRAHSRPPERG